MKKAYVEELDSFCKHTEMSFLRDKAVMITGATGLIGSYLVDVVMYANKLRNNGTKVYAIVRNVEKAKERFSEYLENDLFQLLKVDITNAFDFNFSVNYIIHAASNANPLAFDLDPIGTIKANVNGTIHLLDYAKKKSITKFLYLSSSEIYGEPVTAGTIYGEKSMGIVDPMNPRSCYTESKRMAENICINYFKQFSVSTNIARICFAYGPTFLEKDNRVVPQFIRNALNKENIVLKSTGELVRSYAYLFDVVSGLLKILSDGKPGEVYNISNRRSNVSIREIAETVADLSGVKVIFDLPERDKDKGYAPFSMSLLDSTKLEELGWMPEYNLRQGINQVLKVLNSEKN